MNDTPASWKEKVLRKRTHIGILVFRALNQGLQSSFCCWTAWQGLAHKECSFRRHRYCAYSINSFWIMICMVIYIGGGFVGEQSLEVWKFERTSVWRHQCNNSWILSQAFAKWYQCLKNKHSFYASVGHAVQRRKLLSTPRFTPWFGAREACCLKGIFLRRSVLFTDKSPMTGATQRDPTPRNQI